jgi:NO-binding membrane sensor protein with MHYT domain
MIDVALCIAVEHDLWFVLLAIAICCVGAFVVAQMFERAQATSSLQRFGWIFLTAIAAGATIWCTHFVAMIAYKVEVPVHLDPVLTIVSLIVAIAGTAIGLVVAIWRPAPAFPLVGGGLAGAAIAAMHFTGMAAYRVDGIVEWRWSYVIVSVFCAIVFASAAFAALCSSRFGRSRHAAHLPRNACIGSCYGACRPDGYRRWHRRRTHRSSDQVGCYAALASYGHERCAHRPAEPDQLSD